MYTHLIDRERERDRSEFWLFFLQNWQLASLVLYDRQERPRWKGNWGVPFKSFRWYCTITRRFFSTLASCPSSLYRHRRIATGVVSHSLDNGAEMAPPFPFSTSIEDLHGTFPRESLSFSLFTLVSLSSDICIFTFFKKKTLATHIIRLRPTTCRCRGGVGGDKCSNSFPVHSIFISSKRQPFCLLAFGCQQVNNPPPSLFVSLAFVRQHVWRLLLAECHSSLFSILFCRSPILHDDISSATPSLSAILVGFKFPAATCSNPAPTKGSHNANERESQTNKKDSYTTWWTRLAHNKIKKEKKEQWL